LVHSLVVVSVQILAGYSFFVFILDVSTNSNIISVQMLCLINLWYQRIPFAKNYRDIFRRSLQNKHRKWQYDWVCT
jgi:hypothetical protein